MELRTERMKLADVFPDKAKAWARRLHIKADDIDYVRKGIPIDPQEITIEDGERAAIRFVSTPHLDRDNEILMPDGAVLDAFRESPTVLYGHDYSSLPIGKDIWIKPTKKGILAKTVYANHQFAQDVYDCVKGGFLNSSSVGFIPVEYASRSDERRFGDLVTRLERDFGIAADESRKASRIFTKWILLEHSDVAVPSNAQSLNVMVGKSIQSERLRKDLGLPDKAPEPEPPTALDPPAEEAAEEASEINISWADPANPESKPEEEAAAPAAEPEAEKEEEKAAEVKAEPIDVNLQLLTAILSATNGLRLDIGDLRQDLADLRTSIPMLIVPAAPPAPAVPMETAGSDIEDLFAELAADIAAMKALMLESLGTKADPPAPAPEAAAAPVVEPPAPEKKKEITLDDIKAAVKGLDMSGIIKSELTLALAKIRGRVEC